MSGVQYETCLSTLIFNNNLSIDQNKIYIKFDDKLYIPLETIQLITQYFLITFKMITIQIFQQIYSVHAIESIENKFI